MMSAIGSRRCRVLHGNSLWIPPAGSFLGATSVHITDGAIWEMRHYLVSKQNDFHPLQY